MTRQNHVLRVGLIGCGNVAVNFHLPAYLALPDRFEVVALADPTPNRLELARTAAGLAPEQAHPDPTALLARHDLDVIDLCTPQHLRRDLLLAAAAVGKQVISEKPLASVPAEAAEMVEAAERAGITLGVVHNYLFLPEIIAAQRIIASGELGDVLAVTVNYLGVVDSPGAGGYRPQWRRDPRASGGGVLLDMLHAVYLAEHLLGVPFERVSAQVDTTRPEPGGVEELAFCRFETEGKVGLVNLAWGFGPGGVQVTGTLGRLVIHYRDDGTPPWAPFERIGVTTAAGTRTEPIPAGAELPIAMLASMVDTLRDFADSIEAGRPSAAGGRQALHILTSTLAAYTSAAVGCSVPVGNGGDDAVWREGVAGLRGLDAPEWSPVSRHGLFGVATPSASLPMASHPIERARS
jgi:predicted dehydrogenase